MADAGLPADHKPAKATATKKSTHTVAPKDTFASVALEHGLSVQELLEKNEKNLKHTAVLYVGTELNV